PEMSRAMTNILTAGDSFIDVGANEGWFSILGSFLVGSRGQVVSVEPQERCWPVILRNLTLNRRLNCTVAPYAVGAQEGNASLSLYPSINAEASTMVSAARWALFPRQKTIIITLDALMMEKGFSKVKLLKIDCEGYEFEALKGAAESLRRKAFENLLIEYHPRQLRELGQNPGEIEAY